MAWRKKERKGRRNCHPLSPCSWCPPFKKERGAPGKGKKKRFPKPERKGLAGTGKRERGKKEKEKKRKKPNRGNREERKKREGEKEKHLFLMTGRRGKRKGPIGKKRGKEVSLTETSSKKQG